MLPFQIGRHRGAEREDHCRRVGELASRTSSFLKLGAEASAGLGKAATIHHYWSAFHAASVVPAPRPLESAAAILETLYCGDVRAGGDTGRAAGILEVCDAFDEAMEFAAFEGITLAAARDSFYRETAGAFDGKMVDALRRATEGCEYRPSKSALPVMPRRVAALLRTSDETVSPAELAAIAAGDPVLGAKLIGVANSGRYGSRHTITGLNEAALRVGAPVARKVLLAACLGGLFASQPLQVLWQHSQEVAAHAFALSGLCEVDENAAWLGGLLHDIGRLVLMSCPPASGGKLMDLVGAGFPLTYAETLTFGADHAAVGSALLKDWDIPDEIVAAVRAHHEPEQSDDPLASVLFLAEQKAATNPPEGLSGEFRTMVACRKAGLAASVAGITQGVSDHLACAS
jgi:putative nucleotidyltransferase with HDIG domain